MSKTTRVMAGIGGVLLAVLLLGGLWAASATRNLPPDTTLAGEPVSAPGDALRLLDQVVDRVERLPVVVATAAGQIQLTAGELGASYDRVSVDRAIVRNVGVGPWLDRLTGAAPLELSSGLLFTTGEASTVADTLSTAPVDGRVEITASGVRVVEPVVGVTVTPEAVSRAFRDAAATLETTPLADWPDELRVEVDGDTVEPTIGQAAIDTVTERIEAMAGTPVTVVGERRPEDAQTIDGVGVPTREDVTLDLSATELLQLLAIEEDPETIRRDRLRVVASTATPPPALVDFLDTADIGPDVRVEVLDRSPTPTKADPPEDPASIGPGGPADLAVYADTSSVSGRLEAEVAEPGLEPDLDETILAIVNAMSAGETSVTIRGEETDEFDLAEDFGIIEPVSTFTTFYTPGQSRVTNIHRIAEIVDGALVPPGGNYELNHAVGRRTSAGGFVTAGAILEGEFVTDVGGGVSQFGTTFFNALWFSGLDIITHTPHSFYFERYPAAREATIDYPGVNLELNNNTPHWLLIDTAVTDDSVTVTFWSTRHFEVSTTMGERQPTAEGFRMRVERRSVGVDGSVQDDAFTVDYKLP